MKGGRLHRPEPPGPHASAAPAPAAPAPTPADDWVDGSWTVDCSCGVTFDDGEEMVSCDDCNVWVHTRCARYVRGVHTSFSCHNCKYKRAPSSADETEVAELLAELPTHRPPPLYRRWAEVPLPARVHVHGGSDAALFRGSPSSPAFSAALWRCAGYVPKKFGFRYCEFPSWADDKDGADALFALAREKRKETAPAARFTLSLGNKGTNNAQTLSKKADGSQHARDEGTKEVPPRTDAKTKGAPKMTAEADTRDDGFQPKGDLNMPDIMDKDQLADIGNSDIQVVKADKKVKESSEPSGEKKRSEGNPRMLKTDESKESIRLKISSGSRTASAVAEQEAHSRFGKAEVNICKKQIEGSQNVGLQSGTMDAGEKMDEDSRIHAGSMKVHGGPCLQKQSNQASSNLQDHERTKATQFIKDEHRSDTQGPEVSAGSLTAERNSARSNSDSGSDLPSPETKNQMHTVPEQNSVSGAQKVCTASSGPTHSHFEISHSSVSAEPSSAGKTDRLTKKEEKRLVAPADIKHESVKHSAESSKEFSRSSEKVPPKGSLSSAPKSSQTSRSYVPSSKHRVPLPKEQTHKTPTAGTPARSSHAEVTPSHSRNKAMPSNLPQKKDKTHHRFVHVTQEGSTNSASTELRASDGTASLSDEQLALLLHQQLNSSPRVPRVPRGNQTGSMQMLHQTGATVFSKRSSAHGGRDPTPVSKKRHKDDVPLRDNDDSKRSGKVSHFERRHRDYSTERTPSVKDSGRLADNLALEEQNHGMCSDEATTGLAKDDLMDSGLPRRLPGFIDEIMSRNRNITYEELCDAIGENWRDFVKPKGEDYAYSSFLHALDECLRTKSEWAHLVYQAPKSNPNKRRKVESDSLSADETEKTRNRAERHPGEEGSSDSQQGLPPRGKRKGLKRSRHETKASSDKKTRKRPNINSSSEDAAAASLSDSSSNPVESQDNSSGGDTDKQPNSADSGS